MLSFYLDFTDYIKYCFGVLVTVPNFLLNKSNCHLQPSILQEHVLGYELRKIHSILGENRLKNKMSKERKGVGLFVSTTED